MKNSPSLILVLFTTILALLTMTHVTSAITKCKEAAALLSSSQPPHSPITMMYQDRVENFLLTSEEFAAVVEEARVAVNVDINPDTIAKIVEFLSLSQEMIILEDIVGMFEAGEEYIKLQNLIFSQSSWRERGVPPILTMLQFYSRKMTPKHTESYRKWSKKLGLPGYNSAYGPPLQSTEWHVQNFILPEVKKIVEQLDAELRAFPNENKWYNAAKNYAEELRKRKIKIYFDTFDASMILNHFNSSYYVSLSRKLLSRFLFPH